MCITGQAGEAAPQSTVLMVVLEGGCWPVSWHVA